jgi:membrane protease YdiL (CAAX protease family)
VDPITDRPAEPPLDAAWPAAGAGTTVPDAGPMSPESASSPRVTPVERALSAMEVFLCSGLPTQLLVALALHGLGWTPNEPDGALSLRYVSVLSLADTVLIVGLAHVFLVSRGDRPRLVYFGGRSHLREATLGLASLPLVLAGIALVALTLRQVAPWLHNVPDNPLEALMRDPVGLAVFAVVAVVAGGVREEVQRAFVLHRFRLHLGGPILGLWLFSLVFGAGHLLQGYDAAILTALLGLLWGALYLRRGSVVAPMVSHSLFNLTEVVKQALGA